MSSSGFNSGSFRRDLDRIVKSVGQDEARKVTARLQRKADALLKSSGGQSVDEVMPEVRRILKGEGCTFTEEEVRDWATDISSGERVTIKMEIQAGGRGTG